MRLPVVKVTLPPAANGGKLSNGNLGPCDLQQVWLPGLGLGQLHPVAARSFNSLATMATSMGLSLTASSLGDTYRSYESQRQVFLQRYSPTYNPLTCTTKTKTWNGKRYWLRRGVADVATPGTSNHGNGIAIDVALWDGRNVQGVTSNQQWWSWLQGNAVRFGWSFEAQNEPWHIRHYSPVVTQSVIDLENYLGGLAA